MARRMRNTKEQTVAAERRIEVSKLYTSGMGTRAIAEQLGCNIDVIRRDLRTLRLHTPGKSAPMRKAEAAERRWEIWEKRRAGVGTTALSREYGLSLPVIYEALKWCQGHLLSEAAKEARDLDLARIDAVIEHLWPKIEIGNHQAATTVLRALRQRAEIFGYEAPKRIELATTNEDTEANAELRAKIEKIRQHNMAVAARIKDELTAV